MNSLFLALELFYIPNRVLTPTVYQDRMRVLTGHDKKDVRGSSNRFEA